MSTILKLLMPLYLTTAVVYTTDNQIGEEEVLAGGGINNYQPIINTSNTPNSSNGSSTGGSDTNSPPTTKPTTPVVTDIITDTELQAQLAEALAKAKNDKTKEQKNTTNSIAQKLTIRVEDLLMSNPNYGPITLQVHPKALLKLLKALDQYTYYTSKHKLTTATSNAGNGTGIAYGLGADVSEEMLLLNATVDSKLSIDGQIVGPFNWPRKEYQLPGDIRNGYDISRQMGVYNGLVGSVLLSNPCKSWQDILNATEISTGALIALTEIDDDNTSHQRLKYFYTLSKEQQENILIILINYKKIIIYDLKEYYKDAYNPNQPHSFTITDYPFIEEGPNYLETRVELLGLDHPEEMIKRIAEAGYKPTAESSPTDTRIYTGIGDLVESGVNISNILLLDRDNKDQRRLTFFFTLNAAQQDKVLAGLVGATSTSFMRKVIEEAGGPPVYRQFQSIQEIQDDSEINPHTIAALKLIDEDHRDSSRWNFFITLNANKQADILSQYTLESLRLSIEKAGGPPAYRQFKTMKEIQDDSWINPKTIAAMKELDTTHYNTFFTLTASQQFLVLQQPDEYEMRYAMDHLVGLATLEQLKNATTTDVYNAFLKLDDDNKDRLRLNFFLSLPPGAQSARYEILSALPDINAAKDKIEEWSGRNGSTVPAHFPLKETDITFDALSKISEISDPSKALTLFATLDDKYSALNTARREAFFKDTYKDQITVLNSTDPLSLYNYIYNLPTHGPRPDLDEPLHGQQTSIEMVSKDKAPLIQKLSADEQKFYFSNLPIALQSYILRLTDSSSDNEETKIAIIRSTIQQFGGPAA